MNGEVKYPNQPPKEPDKSVLSQLKKGERPDPEKIGLWFTHDPAIYRDPVTKDYFIYGTGAMGLRSKDMLMWEKIGSVVTGVPKEAKEWTNSEAIWAPDIVKVGDEYRLYCSNSSWGVQQSCIFLAVSDKAEGPFEPRGVVLKTSDKLSTNAIDANIITDVENGDMYMVYGSFWGGIHILKLDKETGLAGEDGVGKCLACRPSWLSTGIEGPYMIYNPKTEYYYLFVSYGSLKMDYQVRVGRSKSVLGPFVDYAGRELTDMDDPDNSVGQMVFCGYTWNDGIAYMAPGHNSVLYDFDDQWYLVCHIREKNFTAEPEPSTMQIRKMLWSEDGWPILCAQPYSGEIMQDIPREYVEGRYERIDLAKTLPQGIQTAVPMKLEFENDYYECCSIQGTWEYADNQVTIKYGPHTDKAYIMAVWDHEKNQPTVALCGMTEKGVPFWAKRVGESKWIRHK